VLIPLDAKSLDDAIAGIKQSGATSVAVCFLHSYLNPVHELAAVERLTQALPDISISRSSDVLPQIKEYERVSTTIVNAYVEPIVRRYLTNLEARLSEAGFKGSLFVVLSHGGMAPVEEASRLAAGTVLSGPAGGMSGGRRCADLVGIPDLVPFDMGGTSTDISLIAAGQASLSADGMLAGQRIALRSLDIASIAAARSPASTPAARCGWGRKAQARCRARPATAMADRPPPSPTPMSCSAISMRPPSWAASVRWTAPPRKPPSTALPQRWSCRAWKPLPASTA
jgi:N-methylhydantoinase A